MDVEEMTEYDPIELDDELPETNLVHYIKSNVGPIESAASIVIGIIGAAGSEVLGGSTSRVTAIAVFLGGATVAFLVMLALDLQESLSTVEATLRNIVTNANNQLRHLARKLVEARSDVFESYAYGILMHEGPHTIDDKHHIRRAWSEFDVTGEQTVIKEQFVGHNYGDSGTEYLELRITKDASLGVTDMCFDPDLEDRTVRDPDDPTAPREEWEDSTWYAESHSPFEVTFYVPFSPPLQPRGNGDDAKFELEYSVRVGEAPDGLNYQWIPQHRFEKETEWLQVRCITSEDYTAELTKVKNIRGIFAASAENLKFDMERIGVGDGYQVLDDQDEDGNDRRIHQYTDTEPMALYIFKISTD